MPYLDDDAARIEFYKELYYAQITERDSIESRLQLLFAIIVALLGALAFLASKADPSLSSPSLKLFWSSWTLSTMVTGVSIFYFVTAYHWHGTYRMMPVATEIERYQQLLIDTYKAYEEGAEIAKEVFDRFLLDYFATWSSYNTTLNDYRSYRMYASARAVIFAVLPLSLAFAVFVFASLEVENVVTT